MQMSVASQVFVPQLKNVVSKNCGECTRFKNEIAELKLELLRLKGEQQQPFSVFNVPEQSYENSQVVSDKHSLLYEEIKTAHPVINEPPVLMIEII